MRQGRLFFWHARALYVGHAFGLRPHRNAVAVLCVSLDEPSGLAVDALHPQRGYVPFTTALIPPNTLHHLRVAPGARMAFLYVDALSCDSTRLHEAMQAREPRVGIGLEREETVVRELACLQSGKPWRDVRTALFDLLGLDDPQPRDPRIAAAVATLQAFPGEAHHLRDVAAQAGLSASYFLHRFKEETGSPYRRYRLWIRMGCALRAFRSGRSLTDAAFEAGFSSSAHFSTAFAGMFGMPPSRLSVLGAAMNAGPPGVPMRPTERLTGPQADLEPAIAG